MTAIRRPLGLSPLATVLWLLPHPVAQEAFWSPAPDANAPAMAHHDMTYDSTRGAVIVAGRPPGMTGAEVSVYQGNAAGEWSPLPSPQPIPGQYDVEIAYNPDEDYTLLYTDAGNQVWKLRGETWTMEETSHTPVQCPDGAFLKYDPVRRNFVLVGSDGWPESTSPSQTWTYDGTDWTLVADEDASPEGAAGGGMAFDAARGEMVLTTNNTGETWTFDGTQWTRKHPATNPDPGVWVINMAYDPDSQLVVYFGGAHVLPDWSEELQDKTWAWDGATWHSLPGTPPLPHNIDYGLAYFPERSAIVMHGGWPRMVDGKEDWSLSNDVYLLTIDGGGPTEIRIVHIARPVDGTVQLTSEGRGTNATRQVLQGTASLGPDANWAEVSANDEPGNVNQWEASLEGGAQFFRILEE
ncbi:MAG: hypothetical protein H7A46_05335 [Verrucomicrobiales bacterium]|nr:hypothetical protein [Verrucomicrobiales bacterium]